MMACVENILCMSSNLVFTFSIPIYALVLSLRRSRCPLSCSPSPKWMDLST